MNFKRLTPNDYIGKTFNYLTVLDIAFCNYYKQTYAICQCKCGTIKTVLPYQLKKGTVKSCGCHRKFVASTRPHKPLMSTENPNYIDGRSRHPLYGIWLSMMHRCYSETSKAYKYYGAKGISVHEEWHDFWSFVKWSESIGGRPEGYTLDRIDYAGNYEPTNCRWITQHEQCRNKSDNIYITYNGKTQILSDWSKELGINARTLNNRINRGWPVERAFTEKVHSHHPISI